MQDIAIVVASHRGLEAFGSNSLSRVVAGKCATPAQLLILANSYRASKSEVAEIMHRIKQAQLRLVIGLGGGRAIDVARAVAFQTNTHFVTVPTQAGTCTASTGWCTLDEKTVNLEKHPIAIILRPKVLASAPRFYLSNGLIEADVILETAAKCGVARVQILGQKGRSFAPGQEQERLRADARGAIEANRRGVPNKSFIRVVRSVILMAGAAFEEVGLGPAHALFMSLRKTSRFGPVCRSDWLAFCSLFQQVLLDSSERHLQSSVAFWKSIGASMRFDLQGQPPSILEPLLRGSMRLMSNGFRQSLTVRKMARALDIANDVARRHRCR